MHKKVEPAFKSVEHFNDAELKALLGIVTTEIARRANTAPMSAEKAEEISRRST